MKKILSTFLLSTLFLTGCLGVEAPIVQESFNLDTLTADSQIASPVAISGQAQGTMYFEGSFPVSIEDANGNVLGNDAAKSQSDWMTEKMVPFKASVTFKNSSTKTGFIVLKNDNPSGLAENERLVKFPISFK